MNNEQPPEMVLSSRWTPGTWDPVSGLIHSRYHSAGTPGGSDRTPDRSPEKCKRERPGISPRPLSLVMKGYKQGKPIELACHHANCRRHGIRTTTTAHIVHLFSVIIEQMYYNISLREKQGWILSNESSCFWISDISNFSTSWITFSKSFGCSL